MNLVTVLLAAVLLLPPLTGAFFPFSGSVRYVLRSALHKLELLFTLPLSLSLTEWIFNHPERGLLPLFYRLVPSLRDAVEGVDYGVYLLAAVFLLFFLLCAFRLLEGLLYRPFLAPLLGALSAAYQELGEGLKRTLGGLVRLPGAAALTLVFCLLLHLYTGFSSNAALSEYIGESMAYRVLDQSIVQPVLASGAAEQTTVFLSDFLDNAAQSISLSVLPALTYINGVSLDRAVETDEEVARLAESLTAGESDPAARGRLLYDWICENISYDYGKGQVLLDHQIPNSSGAQAAYDARSGVCFDYACLYVAMCRAAGVEVRFVSGLGYSDGAWGDHSWNQLYDPSEDRWLDVDATYGSTGGTYFDAPDFSADHKDGTVLGQW